VKELSISKDGLRLLLVIPNTPPLRAAALAIPGVKREGVVEDLIAFSYPAQPSECGAVIETFSPTVASEHSPRILELMEQKEALDAAIASKGIDGQLTFDPRLTSTPMAHQVAAMNLGRALIDAGAPGVAFLMEQGTGKSLAGIGLANYLRAKNLISWVMVVSPNSLKGTWGADDGEILKHTPPGTHRPVILRGTRDKRQAHLRRELTKLKPSGPLPWLITNVDEFAVDIDKGANGVRFAGTLDLIRAAPPGLLILDESSTCKNWKARRTKALMRLAGVFPHRFLLTGTPVEAGPLDVWPQFEILQPGSLGFKTALAFERAYAIRQQRVVHVGAGRTRVVNVIDGYRNLDDLMNRVARWSFRARAADCLDLPPVVARRIPVELSTEQARILRALRDDKMADLGDGAYLDGRNILTRLQKMAQVVGGWSKAIGLDGGDLGWVAMKTNPKLAALEDYLQTAMEDPERKVVIFAEHPETEIAALEALADRNGWGSVVFHGGVSEQERDERRQQFNRDPKTRCFIAQWETAARGLNLTVADTVVFYTLTFRYGTWSQARKRVHRKGQTKTVTEVYLVGEAPRLKGKAERTLDHVQLEALLNKQNVADVVTGDAAAKIIGGE
jgi:SNF2 family DNA or RNA helicase